MDDKPPPSRRSSGQSDKSKKSSKKKKKSKHNKDRNKRSPDGTNSDSALETSKKLFVLLNWKDIHLKKINMWQIGPCWRKQVNA